MVRLQVSSPYNGMPMQADIVRIGPDISGRVSGSEAVRCFAAVLALRASAMSQPSWNAVRHGAARR